MFERRASWEVQGWSGGGEQCVVLVRGGGEGVREGSGEGKTTSDGKLVVRRRFPPPTKKKTWKTANMYFEYLKKLSKKSSQDNE
jgi:hypothetical protein